MSAFSSAVGVHATGAHAALRLTTRRYCGSSRCRNAVRQPALLSGEDCTPLVAASRGLNRMEREGSRPPDLRPHRRRARCCVGRGDYPRLHRRVDAARGPSLRPRDRQVGHVDRRLASLVRVERTGRSDQQRVKRAAFGFPQFEHCRIRALICAGKPKWSLLDQLTPPY